MPFPLVPTWRAEDVNGIPADFLREQGIRLVMLDFDNTLVPYTTDVPTAKVKSWLGGLKQAGFVVCVVSNSHNSRVPEFCKKYALDCITHARKPFTKGIRQCLDRYEIVPRQAVLVGDQIYTDTLGGNCAGVRTVLVRSIHNHTVWLKLRHIAEKPFIYAARKRRISYEES